MLPNGFPIEYQSALYDCAPACLKMIANYYGKSTDALSPLYEHCFLSDVGVSILEIRRVAENLGFYSLAIKCTIDDLKNEVPLPVIAYWKEVHFIVIYDKDEDVIFVADPALGYIQYTYEEFKYGWYMKDEGCGALVAFGV